MVDKEEMGASLFSRTLDFMENDPLEEIFALNMGDFVSEFLISEDLASKIGQSAKDKVAKLKSQLQELVSIYSLDNTLCVLDLDSKDEYVIYGHIHGRQLVKEGFGLDVGVDAHNFKPVSEEDVSFYLNAMEKGFYDEQVFDKIK